MCQFARALMVPDVVDTCLDLHWIQLRGNDNTSWETQHAIYLDAWNLWRLRALSYPSDEYIRWYRGITQVYIGSPANRDTHSHRYQPASVDTRMMEVDDMASVVIREPPSSPSQMVVRTLACTPSSPSGVLWDALLRSTISSRRSLCSRRVAVPESKGARRHLGRGAGGGRPPVPPAPERHEHVDPGHAVVEKGEGSASGQPFGDPFDSPNLDMHSFSLGLTPASQSLPSGSGTSQMPPAPGLGFASFQSPHSTSYGFSRFRASPPPGTAVLSTPHQPISQASSSDEEEREDDMDRPSASRLRASSYLYYYFFIS
ncbi:hypothetical protein M9H77_13767 [Catharanthus roseus]|uniref:Uncharacterized protein n=1 Tax=Catharanthus roseus TaxID=4058 RepID=A0ACC0BLB4_CATRO|nr:hypothetical protein M9H77_13767 [Catharanthus roseus]